MIEFVWLILHVMFAFEGGHLIKNAGAVKTVDEGALLIEKVISDGSALGKFRSMLKAQGVDEDLADKLCSPENDPARYLPKSSHVTNIQVLKSGIINGMIDGHTTWFTGNRNIV